MKRTEKTRGVQGKQRILGAGTEDKPTGAGLAQQREGGPDPGELSFTNLQTLCLEERVEVESGADKKLVPIEKKKISLGSPRGLCPMRRA